MTDSRCLFPMVWRACRSTRRPGRLGLGQSAGHLSRSRGDPEGLQDAVALAEEPPEGVIEPGNQGPQRGSSVDGLPGLGDGHLGLLLGGAQRGEETRPRLQGLNNRSHVERLAVDGVRVVSDGR